jgi:hypothetical protein
VAAAAGLGLPDWYLGADLIGMVVRPNKAIVTREVYEEKTARWAARWPALIVIPW